MILKEDYSHFWLGFDQDVILFKCRGNWKSENTVACLEHLAKFISSYKVKQFAIVVDAREVISNTEVSEEMWMDSIAHWKNHGLKLVLRVHDVTEENYLHFLKGFDDFFKSVVDFDVKDSIRLGIEALHELGYEGFKGGKKPIRIFHD